MNTYRMTVSYEGTGFHGFARQEGLKTIQGELEVALSQILGEPIEVVGAGRTDKGVHARGQVVSFVTTSKHPDPLLLTYSLTTMLSPGICVWECHEVGPEFDARFSAKSRTYHYRIQFSNYPDPLRHRTTYHIRPPLDLIKMNLATQHMVGQHDFSSFCRRRYPDEDLVRTVHSAWWEEQYDDLVVFIIRGKAFCHQMVRSLTGLGIWVGKEKISPEEVPDIFAAKDRAAAPPIVPPDGLILWSVEY